jgi:prophage tail gpP-like protein
MSVRASFIVPQRSNGRARPAHVFNEIGRKVIAYDIDSAMDTDTDTWNVQLGVDSPGQFVADMLSRDTEIRVGLHAVGHTGVETLHSGFADEITLDENGIMSVQGRDITAVAVDSQHPPQIWHGIRPETLVAKEARMLKIGDRLKLTKARGFKTYATDGSESYWQVWYRFYRKRRMWMWAEADATINATTLHYNQHISYYFGTATRKRRGVVPAQFIPVEACNWKSNKNQRVGEVYYFGHRGDIGFVGSADDPATRVWIKRPTLIIASGDAHNQAEARVEAWEEIFESKVGAVEIQLTVQDPGFTIRQDKMAYINLPLMGLEGEFYIVGARQVGSVSDGFYQVIRLREKNYAVSRRVPTDPQLRSGSAKASGGEDALAASLAIDATDEVKQFIINAANKFHGPWPFDLFLGVFMAMIQRESGFRNVREGGSVPYPGTSNGAVPARAAGGESRDQWYKFSAAYVNEVSLGAAQDYGVGFCQLTSLKYKLYADRLSGGPFHDQLLGGRWDPESNIMAGAATFAEKLGAGWSISNDGKISKVSPTGLSLQPTEQNMWAGVAAYNGSGNAARVYAAAIKKAYNEEFKAVVQGAVDEAKATSKDTGDGGGIPSGSSAELRQRVLNNSMVTFSRQSQRDDIRSGQIADHVLMFMLWFTDAGWPISVSALRNDHSKYTSSGNISEHWAGHAIDMQNYDWRNPKTSDAMKFIGQYQAQLGWHQLIGPDPNLVVRDNLKGAAAAAVYGSTVMGQHKSHIHVGWATMVS